MEQLSLFDPDQQSFLQEPPPKNEEAIYRIRGLQYVENYITEDEHNQLLLNKIDKQQWLNDLKRRVQHYGFKYDYKARKVNLDMRIGDGELPEWLKRLSHKLHKDELIPEVPNQVLINEYEPGQGIGGHIDKEPWFKDTIVNLSLGSSCIMEFHKQI